MLSQARNASGESPPTSTNHRLATNPYKSKYGEKQEEEIKQSVQMRKCDALSLMTANETIQWMREMGILKHWILPEKNLNKGMRYENCVPGNAPELNVLDSNLNCNIHCAVLEHIIYTASLKQTDKQKCSVSMPKHQDSAYLKLWNPELQLTL
eukprot:11850048-Ditylum_brightwellii.AAC.1